MVGFPGAGLLNLAKFWLSQGLKSRTLVLARFGTLMVSQRVTYPSLSNNRSGFLCPVTVYFYPQYNIGAKYPSEKRCRVLVRGKCLIYDFHDCIYFDLLKLTWSHQRLKIHMI